MGNGRVVLFPSPFVGHLNPMLDLASLLHEMGGFSIIVVIVHSKYSMNLPDQHSARRYPNFQFVPIISRDDADHVVASSSEDHMAFLVDLNAKCREPFRREMEKLIFLQRPNQLEERVLCLIADAQMYCSREVAEELKLRRIVLRTSSAASFRTFLALPSLREKGFLPIPGNHDVAADGQQDFPVPNWPPPRYRDLPEFPKSSPDSTDHVLTQFMLATRTSDAVIMNTFEALEQQDLQMLQSELINVPVIPIGPLHKVSRSLMGSKTANSSFDGEYCSCVEWLNRHPPKSVLYVSFGSLACMDMHDLWEMARGLANSKQPFLWALREGSVREAPSTSMSAIQSILQELAEETRGRGRVVQWTRQREVLCRPSIGGFWTHCGWNSVLESVCEGVPMICSPCFGDQPGNATVVTHVWQVGIHLGKRELERVEIERAIKRLMVGEEGREMRCKAMRLKADADRCMGEGGSFHASFERLVGEILT